MAEQSQARSQIFCVSKSKVKFDFTTVRTRVIPILKRVEVGDYPSKIGRIYGWSKQHVFYYMAKLQKAGLIRRKVRSKAVFYELTDRGKDFLMSCEGVVFGSGVYRLHKCQIRYRIVREGLLPRDLAKRLGSRRVSPWQVTQRLRRINKRLDRLLGQKAAEKRGMRWALTSFMSEAWGSTKEEVINPENT